MTAPLNSRHPLNKNYRSEVKRRPCDKCQTLFCYAANDLGTTPTQCLTCDPENKHATPAEHTRQPKPDADPED